MDKKKAVRKAVMGFALLSISIVLVSIRRETRRDIVDKDIKSWPDFHARDIRGQPVSGREYRGKVRFIIFLGSADDNNMDIINNVNSRWGRSIAIIIIANRADILQHLTLGEFSNAIIIHDEGRSLHKKFGATKYGKHFIFDSNGNMVYSAENNIRYDIGAERYLRLLVDRNPFRASYLFMGINRLAETEAFSQIMEIFRRTQASHLLVAMVSSFCASCYSGQVIENLKHFASIKQHNRDVILLLSSDYSMEDVEAIRSQYAVDFEILIGNSQIENRWQMLRKEYSYYEANNIVFVVDNTGRVEQILDSDCADCRLRFWAWVAHSWKQVGAGE
jgi:hypothetical protein